MNTFNVQSRWYCENKVIRLQSYRLVSEMDFLICQRISYSCSRSIFRRLLLCCTDVKRFTLVTPIVKFMNRVFWYRLNYKRTYATRNVFFLIFHYIALKQIDINMSIEIGYKTTKTRTKSFCYDCCKYLQNVKCSRTLYRRVSK